MSRWRGAFGSRRGIRTTSPQERSDEPAVSPDRVLVEHHDGLVLLRLPTDDSLSSLDVADLSRTLARQPDTVTVVAGVHSSAAAALWPRLSELLDGFHADGIRSVRLVMSAAGADQPERPATARLIADRWNLSVEAPDGPVLIVPGGSVFVPPASQGWWRFQPGRPRVALGTRMPTPPWQSALRPVAVRTVKGCAVDQIPAGLLIRPAEAAPSRPGDLFHAVPVDPQRPAVVVGVPFGEDVAATDVVELLSPLGLDPDTGFRLVPGGRFDLLRLAQSVATALGVKVEATTGLPLFTADGPMAPYRVRSMVGAGGREGARWLPFVDSVVCAPVRGDDEPVAKLSRWFTPLGDSSPLRERGTADSEGSFPLSAGWHVAVTRAGLRIGAPGQERPRHAGPPVATDGPVIEVGRPGDRLTEALWPELARLLTALPPGFRSNSTLRVHARTPDDGRVLRRLAAEHGVRAIRFSQATASVPAAQQPPVAAAEPPEDTFAPTAGAKSQSLVPAAVPRPRPLSYRTPEQETVDPRLSERPGHSTPAQRTALRRLLGPGWEHHSAAVSRLLPVLPWVPEEDTRAAHDDLVAVHTYLHQPDRPHNEPGAQPSLPLPQLSAYAACLSSGLRRLPTYRGVVLRGLGQDGTAAGAGRRLTNPSAVSGLMFDPAAAVSPPGPAYAIWSVTGRRADVLQGGGNEIVFAPGAMFRVLGEHTVSGNPFVLLRQMPRTREADPPDLLEDADETARACLEQALAAVTVESHSTWPKRCAGPINAP
ncbi:hypothetical protein [Streptomyces sp. NPDC090080]|uniref:hypothetical protein n=1 Tax=Streptomyces sp. NPDC090080 TaxID=3365939 RepID=UPI003808742A